MRRIVTPTGLASTSPAVLHTAGWVRIVATQPESSIAIIVGLCDAVYRGDFLEPTKWPGPVTADVSGQPDYDNPGVILFGLDGRSLLAENDYFVLGLGQDDDLSPGQRLTIFRQTHDDHGAVTDLGEAVVVRVDSEATTARVIRLRDIVEVGDLVAPQR